MWPNFKSTIITGILTIIPLFMTLYILNLLFRILNGFSAPILKFIGFHIPGLGMLLTILVVYLTGLLVRNVLGRRLFAWWEKILLTIPIFNTVYKTIKQFTNAFSGSNAGKNYKKVIFLQYPRKGTWTLAFVTGESRNEQGEEFFHLFIPTTPNPTSGFFSIILRSEAMDTKLTVEEGIKMVISGGMIAPKIIDINSHSE